MYCRSQIANKDGLEIVASDGTTYAITRAQVLAIYQAQTGNAASRKAATIAIIKQQMADAFGLSQFDPLTCDLDFSATDANASISCGHR
jgi:hypothetical protein